MLVVANLHINSSHTLSLKVRYYSLFDGLPCFLLRVNAGILNDCRSAVGRLIAHLVAQVSNW